MADLKSPTAIWIKGVLFLLLGILASVILLLHAPSMTVAVLLCIAVWAFCRAYYFAFYVIEHYVDSDFRYAGLFAFMKYAIGRRDRKEPPTDDC